MRNLLATLLLLLLSSFASAQCNGTYPVLVDDAPDPYETACNGMTSFPGQTPPWQSPLQWIGAANGGNLSVAWSQIPPPPFPSPTYDAWILLDTQVFGFAIPVAPGISPCEVFVFGGLAIIPTTIPTNVGCPVTFIAQVPPLPALAGITIYGQGVMNDPVTPGSWATTNAWEFTL